MISIGAHIHHINIFSPISSVVTDIALVQLITPSVTPIYNNNPGLGMLSISDKDHKILDF